MKLSVCNTGYFKLDGGAMFGVVPKSIWEKTNPADQNNMCSWALRSLLIEDGNRLMIIDCGMGNKQSEKFFSYYYLHGNDSLENSLKINGYIPDDVTDVFLTHLHFDHCGGAIGFNREKNMYQPFFKNATYWSNQGHWNWAVNPNPREKASFLKENLLPIQESGQLKFLDHSQTWLKNAFPNMDIFFANGHTEKQMIPVINYNGKKLAFAADLLPSVGHIPMPYVMGYDIRPLETLQDRNAFYNFAIKENVSIFLEHDAINECCTLQETEKGVRLKDTFSLADFLS